MLALTTCCGSSLAAIVQENAKGKSATNLGIQGPAFASCVLAK